MAACPAEPIACTLAPGDYADRLALIGDLRKRMLLGSRREGRQLILSFRAEAESDVEELARREKECCGFLTFSVARNNEQITLTITAPTGAETMLDNALAPFDKVAGCGCGPDKSNSIPSTKGTKGLAWTAAGLSTLALSCGVCCVVPFLLPAAAAGLIGSAFSFTAGFHGIATVLAAVAVTLAWGAIVLRRNLAARRGELAVTILATAMLLAALSWPNIEQWIRS